MRTTAYLKAIMEVYGKTITGLGPCKSSLVKTNNCMAKCCYTPILWSSSLLLVLSRPDAFKATIVMIHLSKMFYYRDQCINSIIKQHMKTELRL